MGEGGGNVPPQLGLARKLVSRGHQVRVLTEPCVEQDVLSTGASYAQFTKAPHRSDRSRETDFVRDFEAKTPLGRLKAFRDRAMFGPARSYAEDTMSEIKSWQPDVLAPDWIRVGAAIAGEAARVPTALLVHSNNLLPEPGKPPPGFGFLPASSVVGRLRDQVFERGYVSLLNRGLRAMNEARRALGLSPLDHVLEHFSKPARFLCLYPEALELPARRRAPNLRYVGPILDEPAWAEPWIASWPSNDQRPLVVLAMSTTYMRQERAIQRCIEAMSVMPVRAVVTLGPTLDPAQFASPDNIIVVRSAPHDQLFREADAVITHAGMGSALRALANGVPMLCLPMGRDQKDIAARVHWHRAGIRISQHASAVQINASLQRVLTDASFREDAGRIQQAIHEDVEADRAVIELESLAGVKRSARN